MKTKFLPTALIALALVATLGWTKGAAMSTSPTARGYHQMTYDTESKRVIVYGGQTGNFFENSDYLSHETWTFDPDTSVWTQVSPDDPDDPNDIPGGSGGGDMIYDSKADRSILSVLADDFSSLQTWAYDANSDTWARLADGPKIMVGQRIVYDSESDRIIMFGGFDFSNFKLVDETWAYDYNTNTWTNMNPRIHPTARNFQGMGYDSKADRVVMWGGAGVRSALQGPDKPAVWTYDYNTNTWEQLESSKNGPAVRYYINPVYDAKADRIIMYGGYDYGNNETWLYDLNTNTWQQVFPDDNPGAISRYGMVYVKDVNRTILFGGQDGATHFQYKGDTWSYNLKADRWINITPSH